MIWTRMKELYMTAKSYVHMQEQTITTAIKRENTGWEVIVNQPTQSMCEARQIVGFSIA